VGVSYNSISFSQRAISKGAIIRNYCTTTDKKLVKLEINAISAIVDFDEVYVNSLFQFSVIQNLFNLGDPLLTKEDLNQLIEYLGLRDTKNIDKIKNLCLNRLKKSNYYTRFAIFYLND
jgi:hypothetical protein